jgi:hypothetical protein
MREKHRSFGEGLDSVQTSAVTDDGELAKRWFTSQRVGVVDKCTVFIERSLSPEIPIFSGTSEPIATQAYTLNTKSLPPIVASVVSERVRSERLVAATLQVGASPNADGRTKAVVGSIARMISVRRSLEGGRFSRPPSISSARICICTELFISDSQQWIVLEQHSWPLLREWL